MEAVVLLIDHNHNQTAAGRVAMIQTSASKLTTQVVVGAPIFGNCTAGLNFRSPIGQVQIARPIFQENLNSPKLSRLFLEEYMAIVVSLKAMGVDFRIIKSYARQIVDGLTSKLTQAGFKFLTLPDFDYLGMLFPRDLATTLPNGQLLISEEFDTKRVCRQSRQRNRLKVSPYAVGGRILLNGNKALVTDQIWFEDHRVLGDRRPQLNPLRQAGLEVGILPSAICLETSPTSPLELHYEPEDHLDRTSGLLRGKDGQLHLIIDPQIHSGFTSPFEPPLYGPAETIASYLETCSRLGINLHIPSQPLSVPMSTGFWQDRQTGKVLMTSGDDKITTLVGDIVGIDRVFQTPVPIRVYPALLKAGVRCLIGELPSWLQ